MPKKNSNVARRACNLLRLAFIWARKGGIFKRRFLMELRLVPKFMKSLGHSTPRGQLHYGEHELSFDETPVIHVKMHRPASMRFHFPCISPQVDFDYEFDDSASEGYGFDGGRKSCLYVGDEQEQEDDSGFAGEGCEREEEGEDGIDLRAEKFIAKFYEQMKLQRQISYMHYNHNFE